MNFMGEFIPLCPETRVGGKSTAANPDHVSAGVESAWYRGDPTMPRLFKAQHRGEPAPDHSVGMMKSILQGDFYNLRENGFSSIVHSQKAPDFSVDGSYFQPGVKGDMTWQQERAFFKKQAHDDLNRTYVSRIVKGDFMYGDLKKRPRLNVTNKIAQNRMAASKPNSRSQSALERRTGASPTAQSDWRPPQRREAERIANASGALFDRKAHCDVLDFLAKTSQENRESLEELFGSMLGPTDRRPHATDRSDTLNTRPAAEATIVRSPSGDSGAVRPGTASIMERSERDLQRTVATQLHKSKPPGADDPQILTPKFGVTTLLKQRLMGHRAECTGKIGHLTSFEERIRDLRKALRDHIYVKVNDKKEAWKWVNPDLLGYIDVQSLYNTMREFMIDCTVEECAALHGMLDLDGDGLIGFEDMNNALFDTALGERDYFRVTDKPCSDIANERILFQGYQIADEKLGDSIQSDWARLSRKEDNGKSGTIPHGQTDAARPQTVQTNYDNGRPATSATEVSKLAPRPSTGQRPSTSMVKQQSLRKNYNQLWNEAARISALTGGQESVEDIRKVLGKIRPVTAEPRSGEISLSMLGTLHGAQHDTEQSGSKCGNSFARDASAQKKIPGTLPRNITAEQARQLMAKSQTAPSHPVTNHAGVGHISAGVAVFGGVRGRPSRIRPHQFHHVFRKRTTDLPPTTKVQAVSTNLHSNDKPDRQGSTRDEIKKPKPTDTSSFFLTASMGAVPARDGGRNKTHVGVERPGADSRTQTLTID